MIEALFLFWMWFLVAVPVALLIGRYLRRREEGRR